MTSEGLLIALGASLVAIDFVVRVALTWLASRWCGIARPSVWRAIRATSETHVLYVVTAIVAAAAIAFGVPWIRSATESLIWLVAFVGIVTLAALMLYVAAPWQRICSRFNATWRKAGLATLDMLAPATAATGTLFTSAIPLVVKGYTVPTGRMATTIIGFHSRVDCAECGLAYDVGRRPEPYDLYADSPEPTTCPNCGHVAAVSVNAPRLAGDRVLVERWAVPRRWQLAVFEAQTEPKQDHVQRIVGLPGESVDIFGGDLFIDGRRQTKLWDEVEEMWLPVNNTQFRKSAGNAPVRGWVPQETDGRWSLDENGWSNSQADGSLEFEGEIRDQLAYNRGDFNQSRDPKPAVNDVMVEVELPFGDSEGEIEISASTDAATVVATLNPGQSWTLTHSPMAEPPIELQGTSNGGRRLTLAIRDGHARLAVDGMLAASLQVLPESLDEARASGPQAPCRLTLATRRRDIRLSRIRVWRDVYYRSAREMELYSHGPRMHSPLDLGPVEFYVLGDNSIRAADSRIYGPVNAASLRGVVRWIYWPPGRWSAP